MTMVNKFVSQLEQNERGQMTCKLLLDFLKSPTVRGLDGPNSHAVAGLIVAFMNGSGEQSCAVQDALYSAVERHPWTTQ
jgi:hypothetical protein